MKRVLLLLALTVAIVSCSAPRGASDAYRGRYPNRAAAIAAQIHDPNSKYVIVACHRGDWRNFPENSIPAIESVIKMGADIVEIDLKMTADSVLVLSHDTDVKRCTNFSSVFRLNPRKRSRVRDLTLAEIKSLSLKRAQGAAIDTLRIPTLREALLCTRDRICVNVDQGYEYYDQVLAIAEELGVTDQILIKSSRQLQEVAEREAAHPRNVMYMPVVNIQTAAGLTLFNSYISEGVTPLAYEVCWKSNDDGLFRSVCRRILNQGAKIWVNTLWPTLCGGYGNDDDAAYMAKDPGEVYQQYIDNGVSMIQTDRPELLIGWLKKKGLHNL